MTQNNKEKREFENTLLSGCYSVQYKVVIENDEIKISYISNAMGNKNYKIEIVCDSHSDDDDDEYKLLRIKNINVYKKHGIYKKENEQPEETYSYNIFDTNIALNVALELIIKSNLSCTEHVITRQCSVYTGSVGKLLPKFNAILTYSKLADGCLEFRKTDDIILDKNGFPQRNNEKFDKEIYEKICNDIKNYFNMVKLVETSKFDNDTIYKNITRC
jgi:hypothetical protein